jgi:predicted RNA-binding Zn ribbon-like protein
VQSGVPEQLWLVESFLNSVDVESAQDDLDALPRFRRWLRDHHRAAAAGLATEADLTLARDLRTALRAELTCGIGERDRARLSFPGAWTSGRRTSNELDRLAGGIGLAVRFDEGGRAALAPTEAGVRGVLGEVLAAIVRAEHDGTWARLKICASAECRYVYYDRSKNGSRRWCSMRVCGNRNKTRAYRERVSAS